MRNTVSDLIIVRSDRVSFHPLLITPRGQISPLLANNLEFVCLDAKPDRCLVVCKHCHTVFYNETWNRPNISRHLSRFHGIAESETELKPRVHKRLQATKTLPNEHTSAPTTPNEHDSPPSTPMEAAPSPSLVIKISKRRKPSKEVTVPQDTEARKPSQEVTVPQEREASASNTLDTDELPLAAMKPAAKKRSQRRKPSANDAHLKKRKIMFLDKNNF